MYHPTDAGELLEFIELYNDRAVFEDLGGWQFTEGIDYRFPDNTLLPAKSTLVVARHPGALAATYDYPTAYGPYQGSLRNSGERIELSHPNGAIVLTLTYDDQRPWPLAPDGTGHSLERARLGGDPAEASTWQSSSHYGGSPGQVTLSPPVVDLPQRTPLITVGHPGRFFKGTREPSADQGDPTTQWATPSFTDSHWDEGPSGYGYSNESSELEFIRTPLDDMQGNYISVYARLPFQLSLTDFETIQHLQAKVHYDDGFVLYLNGHRVGDSGNISGTPPAYHQATHSASEYVPLTLDLSSHLSVLVPGTNVLAIQGHNGRLSGSSDFICCPTLEATFASTRPNAPTPHSAATSQICINEIQADPNPWVELYNPGPNTVSLAGLFLSNAPADLLQQALPALSLEAQHYLQLTFPLLNDLSTANQERLYLTATDPNGTILRVLDAIAYEAVATAHSWGRSPDGSSTLTELSPSTPSERNATPFQHPVAINEIMYHHPTGDERYTYIELTNTSEQSVSLSDWRFTDGIDYTFPTHVDLAPGGFLVIARDPAFLATVYNGLVPDVNLLGPFTGNLSHHSERLQLSYPHPTIPQAYVIADEVTYCDGGRWPHWPDGDGASLELITPQQANKGPDAWAASDESNKTTWEPFSLTISLDDPRYTHDQASLFDMMLLHRGEVLLDDLQVTVKTTSGGGGRGGVTRTQLTNGDFESNPYRWRFLGNHTQSFVTQEDAHSGQHSLHLIATGHGDPGANRINQTMTNPNEGHVTFSGWARWRRGCPFVLLRLTNERSPVQPPRPSHTFTLTRPENLGTPGQTNSVYRSLRGPDICKVQHHPVLPTTTDPITVTCQLGVTQQSPQVTLAYRNQNVETFTTLLMHDDGQAPDNRAGDFCFSVALPPAPAGTLWSFYVEAQQTGESTRFPTRLATAQVPERTCQIRVGDTQLTTQFNTYRVWITQPVLDIFHNRPNLSNEKMDCTFVYNNTEVFYNAKIRLRGSPFLRGGWGRSPLGHHGQRLEFNSDQRFRDREEINLDNMEVDRSGRGPLQERASYWFYEKMGLPFSRQEYVRIIANGQNHGIHEDVQKIDGNYISRWFPQNDQGYIHKIDDYFEFEDFSSSSETSHSNLDEGLKYDSRHPLLPETYRWGFEKRSHSENDHWDHLFDLALALNHSRTQADYESVIESVIHPEHFLAVLALRHTVGDWDSYGYRRGKNNYFYYALPEGKWYLLPWDIDFTLGSGDSTHEDPYTVDSYKFPEIAQLLRHPAYRETYSQFLRDLIAGPWQTAYSSNNPQTDFDRFLDNAANVLDAEELDASRRNSIKAFVRNRRETIQSSVSPDTNR